MNPNLKSRSSLFSWLSILFSVATAVSLMTTQRTVNGLNLSCVAVALLCLVLSLATGIREKYPQSWASALIKAGSAVFLVTVIVAALCVRPSQPQVGYWLSLCLCVSTLTATVMSMIFAVVAVREAGHDGAKRAIAIKSAYSLTLAFIVGMGAIGSLLMTVHHENERRHLAALQNQTLYWQHQVAIQQNQVRYWKSLAVAEQHKQDLTKPHFGHEGHSKT